MKENRVDELIALIAEMLEGCGSYDACRETYLLAQSIYAYHKLQKPKGVTV